MKILIATGIYPPDIGGPAQYAKGVEEAWKKEGHQVKVLAFSAVCRTGAFEQRLPSGIRHLYYFFRVLFSLPGTDFVFSPDTYSAAIPALFASKFLGKKIIVRTGGDFLWEWYVERTGDLVLLRDFYNTRLNRLNAKEQVKLFFIRQLFSRADAIIFSTAWQRDIFEKPYRLDLRKCFVVENYYGEKLGALPYATKNFVAGTRPVKWKNAVRVAEAFRIAEEKGARGKYDDGTIPHAAFLEKIRSSYAVIIASLGDISPNTILDAIRCDKPFILTQETGYRDKLKDVALFVDPEDVRDIAEKIAWLCNEQNYKTQQEKVKAFTFRHSWEEIAEEVLTISRAIPNS